MYTHKNQMVYLKLSLKKNKKGIGNDSIIVLLKIYTLDIHNIKKNIFGQMDI